MPSSQFNRVIETVVQLESSIAHMSNKWNLFYLQGFLPRTDVFDDLILDANKLKLDLEDNKVIYQKIFDYEFPRLWLETGEKVDDKTKALLFENNLTKTQIENFKKTNIMHKIGSTNSIKNNLYYRVESISDMLNALNYAFINRVSGIFSPEIAFAKDVATKKFGGIQLIYDAAETLMKDYVQTFSEEYLFSWDEISEQDSLRLIHFLKQKYGINWDENARVEKIDDGNTITAYTGEKHISLTFDENTYKINVEIDGIRTDELIVRAENGKLNIYLDDIKYNGLVVFGFRNRAVAYPRHIVVFPAYSEHDLEFLTILAHESFLFLISSVKSKGVGLENKKMLKIQSKLEYQIKQLACIYLPEDMNKNTPEKIVIESLAHELQADIYATIIAGESYPLMLYNYYLPILFDIESGRSPDLDYSTFTLGSLKLRVSLATLKKIYKIHDWDVKEIDFKAHKQNINTIDDFYRQINNWENLSINLTRIQKGEEETLVDCVTYLFTWDEVPGKDGGKLRNYLEQNFNVDWIKKALIEKIDDDKAIRVFTKKNNILLRLNEKKTEAYLYIDNVIIDKFIMITKNGELKICIKPTIKNEIENVCDKIERIDIIDNMYQLINNSFYPKDVSLEDFESKMFDVYNKFKLDSIEGAPTHEEVLGIWDHDWFKPKHLISLLAKYPKNINRNALLVSLAYHENITSRFR